MFLINHKHWHFDRHWEWQPVKATKIDVLKFIDEQDKVTAHDLVSRFGYTYSSARCRLSQLKKEGYIEPLLRGEWCLSNRGYKKIRYLQSRSHDLEQRKREQENEAGRLKQQVEEQQRLLAQVRARLIQMSEEFKSICIAALSRQTFRPQPESYLKLTRLLAEADEVIKKLKAAE
jgi:uncharacterized coiled-coil protein SlyX